MRVGWEMRRCYNLRVTYYTVRDVSIRCKRQATFSVSTTQSSHSNAVHGMGRRLRLLFHPSSRPLVAIISILCQGEGRTVASCLALPCIRICNVMCR